MHRAELKQVWLWDQGPGRDGRDIGIDLVAEDREGGLWAIQAKHYDPAYAIKKADLDSFLSASSRAEFTYRLLIAIAAGRGPARSNYDFASRSGTVVLVVTLCDRFDARASCVYAKPHAS